MTENVEMKVLKFSSDLLVPVLTGKETLTLRKFDPSRHIFTKDELFMAKFGQGIGIVLRSTRNTSVYRLGDVPKEDLLADCGYESPEEALEEMRNYYMDMTLDTMMAGIGFRFPTINMTPTMTVEKPDDFENWLRKYGSK